MSALLQVSKLDAARRQLETAITLYFQFGDPVSIYALAAAACELLGTLAKHYGIEYQLTLETLLKAHVKPEYHQRIKNMRQEPKNFFKHADRDPDAVLNFKTSITELVLLEAVDLYHRTAKEWPPLLRIYRMWWLLQNRDAVLEWPPEAKDALEQMHYDTGQRERFFTEWLPVAARRAVGIAK